MGEYSYIMPLIHNPEDFGCVLKVVKTIHYDSIVTKIDSTVSPSIITQVHDFYASSYNDLLEILTFFLTIIVALIGIKWWIDYGKMNEFKDQISKFESRIEKIDEKITLFEKTKLSFTEHIIEMWVNLGLLKETEGNEKFAYICFMNALDFLGRDFHKEDYDFIKCSGIIKKLKEKDAYERRAGECSLLDEIDAIRRVVDKLKGMSDEKETIGDLNDLINVRLAQPQKELDGNRKKCKKIKGLYKKLKKLFAG